MSPFSLQEKVAVVTGGASGIGAATVSRFLAAGATVVSVDLTAAAPDGATAMAADVSSERELVGCFEAIASGYGRIDILVSNAGIQPLGVPIRQVTGKILDKTFSTNVNSVAYGLKHAPGFMPATGGRILHTGSFVGSLGVPGGSAYAASKAAVAHLTRCGAIELARRNITVNAVAPGTIATPAVLGIPDNPEIPFVESRTPLGRLGSPEDVAAAFHFLASDEAAYITGVILPVDGGIAAGWERYDLVPPPDVKDGQWIT